MQIKPGKAMVSTVLLLAATAQGACMTAKAEESCKIEGAQYLSSQMSAAELCARFQERLARKVGSDRSQQLSVTLNVDKSGTIDAHVSDKSTSFPTVSVDVMDRALNNTDLDRLADSVADVIARQ